MKKNKHIRNKLDHLDTNQIKALKSAYYTGTPTAKLIEQYHIDIHPNSLYKTFPLEKNPHKLCVHCHSYMYLIPPPKSAANRKEYICTRCKHRISILKCRCTQCKSRQDMEMALEHSNTILSYSDMCNIPKTLESLHLSHKSYLGAFLRTHLSPHGLSINLNSSFGHRLAPTYEYSEFIIEVLIKNKLIAHNTVQNTDKKFFMFDSSQANTLYSVCIFQNGKTNKEILTQLMFPDVIPIEEKEHFTLLHLLSDLQIYEAIEYMMYCIEKFHLHPFDADDRFEFIFSEILLDYSLSQLFNFIYTTVRNLAAYSQQKSNRFIHTENYMHKGIRTTYEKAKRNHWEITDFNRPWDLPQSELSKLLNEMHGAASSTFCNIVI